MGTLQLLDIRQEVISHLGERDDLTPARANRVINLMQERMGRAHDFEELQLSVTGQLTTGNPSVDRFLPFSNFAVTPKEIFSFTLPTDDGRGRKLTGYLPRTFDQQIPDPEFLAEGTPSIYTLWDNKFELWKIPDEAYPYVIRMVRWPKVMSNDSDKSSFDRKDDLIILVSVSYLFNSYGEYDKAGRFFGIFSTLWDEAVAEDIGKPDRDLVNPKGASVIKTSANYWLDPFVRSVETGL